MIFADFEMQTNMHVLNILGNVQVRINGVSGPGIFRQPASVAQLGTGAADTSPTVVVASSAVMDKPVEQQIEIAGVPYIIGAADPDGTGLTKLTVERMQ